MIHSLQLENFRKHSKLDLNFTAGMNGIFGPNYTGKTTILYGVLFCLGGITAVPCKSVIKSGCTTFTASMTFEIEGKIYKVLRTKSTDKLFSVVDGVEEMIANGAKVVNKHIEKLIGMTMARFCQIRYSRQKFTSALLTLGATELHNILSDVSGADFVQQVLLRLTDMKKKLEWEVDGKEVVDLDTMEAEFAEAIKDMVTASGLVERAKLKVGATEVGLATRVEQAKQVAADNAAWEKYAVVHDTIEVQVQNFSRLHADAVHAQNAAGKLTIRKPVEKLLEEQESFSQDIRTLKAYLNREELLADRAERSGKKMAAAKEAFVADQVASAHCTVEVETEEELERVANAKILQENYIKTCQKVTELSEQVTTGICKSCNRPLDGHFDVEQVKKELDNYNDLAAEQSKALAFQANKIKELQAVRFAQQNQADKMERAKEASASTLAAAESQYNDDKAELDKHQEVKPGGILAELEAAYDVIGSEIKEVRDNIAYHQKLADDVAYADNNLQHVLQCQKDLGEAPKTVKSELVSAMNTEVDSYRLMLQNDQQELVAAEGSKRDVNARFRELELAIAAGKVTNEEISKKVTRLSAVKALQKFLQDNKDEYMREVWASLMADATQLVLACTEGDIEALERTEDGKFAYTEDGQQYNVSEASGAQAAIMGLAVQTALARALPPVLDVLLVDEPTADMDDERSMVFSMLLPTRAAQVICISHARMDSSTCQNIIDLGV